MRNLGSPNKNLPSNLFFSITSGSGTEYIEKHFTPKNLVNPFATEAVILSVPPINGETSFPV